MIPEGKGFYLWQLLKCEGGDPNAIAAVARKADLSHVLIKVADATYSYNYDKERNIDLVPAVARALRNEGIAVWGWQYIYGNDPMGEARKAIQRVRELDLDGFVVNAEKQFKESGKDVAARKYMSELRNALPDLTIGLSTYRYPSYHPQFPYKEFLLHCDVNMPQVYWMGSTNPAAQLIKTVREYQNIPNNRPMVPTGFAFTEHGYSPQPNEVAAFMDQVKAMGLKAANFWEWSSCRSSLPKVWNKIRDYSWPSLPAEKDLTDRYIEALNAHDPVRVALLYTEKGVHVNAARTVQGMASLLGWYNALFNTILPNATFELTGVSGSGNSRHLTWTATSSTGSVMNGNDTFGFLDGKIAYHYTFFTVG